MRTVRNPSADQPPAETEQRTRFTVTSYGEHGERLYSTLPLDSAERAVSWHDNLADKPATQRITIVANAIEQTRRVIAVDELPGPGEATPQPALPEDAHSVLRYYQFSSGPTVLRTGDEARACLKRITEAQQRPTPHTVLVDLARLRLFEVTLIEHARLLTYAELTDLA